MKMNSKNIWLSILALTLTTIALTLFYSTIPEPIKRLFFSYIIDHWKEILGVVLLICAGLLLTKISPYFERIIWQMPLFNIFRKLSESPFSDVDERINRGKGTIIYDAFGNTIFTLHDEQESFSKDELENIIKTEIIKYQKQDQDSLKSFENYFNSLRKTLEEKASMADEKASILLDSGTAYSLWGIIFFIVSIISWQLLSWKIGFQPQFIYGIVSCSVLFIFIEFLSAWFLKQYRQFIDTSTYLIKVKSIFDKYMLSYLLLKEAPEEEKNKRIQEMLDILKEEIKWPESYLLKSGDISFAKETLEALTYFARNMKEQAKSETK